MSNGYVDTFERNGTTANMHDTDLRNTIGQVNGLAQLDSNGKLPSNVVPSDTTKADKVTNPTNGNLTKLDSSGNLADSGVSSSTLEAIVNVYGSKNLFPDFIESQTYKGITWTKNADSSITVNGTAEGWSTRTYSGSIKLKAGTYILSSGLAWPDCYDVYAELAYNDGTSQLINTSQAEEVTFTLANDTTIPTIRVVVRRNETVSNITIKPMIRDARISDSTYVPYAMTNRELTKNIETVANKDREFVYEQRDQNITITFSGNANTRVPAGLLLVSGQNGVIEPIYFMFSGTGNYPTRESIDNCTVHVSPNSVNITGGTSAQNIIIPAGLGYDWGYIVIKEIGYALKDITITVTYS